MRLMMIVLVLAASCSDGPSQPDAGSAVLTAAQPAVELPLGVFAPGPTTLRLVVTRIENPSSQAFSITSAVLLAAAGATSEEEVGSVTPFPADSPATFMLSVPGAARQLLTRSDGQLRLRLALAPVHSDQPLQDPLEVTFGEVELR